jgi:hypothetical protein
MAGRWGLSAVCKEQQGVSWGGTEWEQGEQQEKIRVGQGDTRLGSDSDGSRCETLHRWETCYDCPKLETARSWGWGGAVWATANTQTRGDSGLSTAGAIEAVKIDQSHTDLDVTDA